MEVSVEYLLMQCLSWPYVLGRSPFSIILGLSIVVFVMSPARERQSETMRVLRLRMNMNNRICIWLLTKWTMR